MRKKSRPEKKRISPEEAAKSQAEARAIGQRLSAAIERKAAQLQLEGVKAFGPRDVAQATDLAVMTVYKHIWGNGKPNAATAFKYARCLDITVEWLLGETVVTTARPTIVDASLRVPLGSPAKGSGDVSMVVAEFLSKNLVSGVTKDEIAHLARLAKAERELTADALELLLLTRRVSQTHAEDDIAAYAAAARRQGLEAGGKEVDLTPKPPLPPSPDKPSKARRTRRKG